MRYYGDVARLIILIVLILSSCQRANVVKVAPVAPGGDVYCVQGKRLGRSVYACAARYADCRAARAMGIKWGRMGKLGYITGCARMRLGEVKD